MLVLCVGMYRACSTWQYGVTGQLLERYRSGHRLGFVDVNRFEAEVEPSLDLSGWSVLKAHDALERFGELLASGKALAIYSHRDLRDVAFSWIHKTGLSFDDIVDRGFLELCMANDRFWRHQPATLNQSYEDLISNPVLGVVQIARHLGIDLEAAEAEEIAGSLSWEANRKRTRELTERLRAEGVPLDSMDQERYDRESLLHWNHLRDGQAGTWRELATSEQKVTLARICGPWLKEQGYEPDTTWAATSGPTIPKVSYAQNMEDILLDRLFQGRQGTFIDVGANHPTLHNNTYYFYLRGWRGVNVEPVPSAFQLFGDQRPDDLNLRVAISDVEGELPFYEVVDCNGLSSLSFAMADAQRANGFQVVERVVPTRTVAGLIERYGLTPPDLFSIDVEGNEEKVLRGIPLATWQPRVFVIEATRPMTNILCHQSWEPLLLEHGYLFAAFDGINRFYLRSDLADSLPLFEYPVNPLDFYERAETVQEREKANRLHGLYEEERRATQEARARATEEYVARIDAIAQFAAERDSWQRERDAWQRERDSRQQERDAVQQERDAVQQERDAVQQERDSVQRERDSMQRERDAVQRERDAFQQERDAVHHRTAQSDEEIARLREALARQNEAVLAERVRADEERNARALEVHEARTLLRPYRMIDRFGVVTALHRRVRADRKHPLA